MWPNITTKKPPLDEADEWCGKPGKLDLLSPEPATEAA
ncbi:MAG: DUF3470 domain-containing protein [Hyphomicrobiales bacterium]